MTILVFSVMIFDNVTLCCRIQEVVMKKLIMVLYLISILSICSVAALGQDKSADPGKGDSKPSMDNKNPSPESTSQDKIKEDTDSADNKEGASKEKPLTSEDSAGSGGASDPGRPSGFYDRKESLVPRLMSMMELGIDWVLWLLFALGGIGILIFIERLVYFSVYGGNIQKTRRELISLLADGDFEKAKASFRSKKDIAGRVTSEALEHAHRAPEAVQEIVESRLMEERQRLERGLSFVGTVGSNAPFIGLFGTVLGIIKAFHDLSLADQAGTSVVMVGISEALVATAVGLLVAIPSVVIFNVFKTRTKSILYGTESIFKLFLSRQLDICLNREENSMTASDQSLTES